MARPSPVAGTDNSGRSRTPLVVDCARFCVVDCVITLPRQPRSCAQFCAHHQTLPSATDYLHTDGNRKCALHL
jgi:hypothetical protein